MTRQRADALLVARGIFPSRERARAAILAGQVRADGTVLTKAGQQLAEDVALEVAERPRYVSRGGDKLAGALAVFGLDVRGMRAIDVGASTGGFTDCLLQHGADRVTALDVGYGQLAWSLRNDERVTVVERTNVRYADPVALGAPFDLVVVDLSFISLRVVLPALMQLLGDSGELVALVKPQFEAGRGHVGKKGVVRDRETHRRVLDEVVTTLRQSGLGVNALTFSPITGPEGNIEFWVRATAGGIDAPVDTTAVVAAAHDAFGG